MSDELPQFNATNPAVIPAQDTKIYDKWWMQNFKIIAPDPTKPVQAIAVFVPCRDVSVIIDGVTSTIKEIMPNGTPKRLVIEDVFKLAETNTDIQSAIITILTSINNIAQAENIL